jgi:hypothetical protein
MFLILNNHRYTDKAGLLEKITNNLVKYGYKQTDYKLITVGKVRQHEFEYFNGKRLRVVKLISKSS